MILTSKSSMSNTRPISLSSVQSENQIRQYRLEQQIANQNTAMDFLQTFLSVPLDLEDPHNTLKDGVTLCMLLNKISPGTVKQISKAPTPFSKMSNIYNFLNGATKLGLEDADLFETVDLYEGKDMARVYLTILAVARKLCNISFSKRSSDRESKGLARSGSIIDEKIFSDHPLSPETPKASFIKTPSPTATLIPASSIKKSYIPPTPPTEKSSFMSPPAKFAEPVMFPLKHQLRKTKLPEFSSIPKPQPPAFSVNLPGRTSSRKFVVPITAPLNQTPKLTPSASKLEYRSSASFLPTSPENGVSDKIKNLRLFFDSGVQQATPPKPIPRGTLAAQLDKEDDEERSISSPNLLASIPMKGSFSTPAPSKLSGESGIDEVSYSFESDISSRTHVDTVVNQEPDIPAKPIKEFGLSRVPTAKDRIIKPLNYRVGRGGIIEDLDLSIKKVNPDSSRGDVLRLDNIDWELDDDDEEDGTSSLGGESCLISNVQTDHETEASFVESPESSLPSGAMSDYEKANDSRTSKIKDDPGLKKQHSRNYSEKPQSLPLDTLPTSRRRAGSAGPSDYPKDRLSLFFENSKLLAQYQLGDCIGKGQFGSVYKALNLQTGQIVAVKRVDLDGRSKPEIESLMGEVDLLKSLSHVRIVDYEGYVKTELYLNIVLEYVENGSLLQLLRSYGAFSETLVASYTSQILEGLMYLHDKQVVHCDLKAANILSTKNGKVKLTDFGVSLNLKVKDSDLGEIVAGTPNWMAPEVITLQGASTASDIWSLGCTIVELLTGKPPYSDMNAMAALYRIVEDDCPPLPKDISASLDSFLRSCFKKKPTKRPTAEELSYHDWIIETQLVYGVNNKLKIFNTDKLVEEKKRESQITDSLWETCYSFADSTLLTPPASTTTMRLPDQMAISASEHNFIRSAFAKPILCKVCKDYAKKQAMMCHDCKIICHTRCVENVKVLCRSNDEEPLTNLPQFSPRRSARRQIQGTRPSQSGTRRGFYSEGAIASGSNARRDFSVSPTPNKSTLPWAAQQKIHPRKKRHNDDCCIS